MKFSYQAKTKQGELQSGVVEAFSREAAIDVLQRHGLIILKLNTESEANSKIKYRVRGPDSYETYKNF